MEEEKIEEQQHASVTELPAKTGIARYVKLAVTILGFIAALIAIWQVIPKTPDEELDILTGHPKFSLFPQAYAQVAQAELNISQENIADVSSGVQIAAKKITVSGEVRFPSDRVLVANDLIFQEGAKLVIPGGHITVIAPRMSGVHIDVSGGGGSDGVGAGQAGSPGFDGGSIYLASARFINTKLSSNGGRGGAGVRGAKGADGRRGRCGAGRYRAARNGSAGQPGGAAGNGGNGGQVSVLYRYTPPTLEAAAGVAGTFGAGGSGGGGGRGCTGLGGTQSNRSAGAMGANGASGFAGRSGAIAPRKVGFRPVINAFETWSSGTDLDPTMLRAELDKVPETED